MQAIRSNKEYFKRSRDFFDERFSRHIFATRNAYRKRYYFVLSRLGVKPSDMTLDVGCAQGGSLLECQQRAIPSYGLDFSLEALKTAKRLGIRNLICADAHKIPLRDKLFDKIIVLATLETLSDKKAAIAEIIRVAKTGAQIYFEIRNGSFVFRKLANSVNGILNTLKRNNHGLFHIDDPSYHEYIELLKSHGLAIEKVYKSPVYLYYENPVQFFKTIMIKMVNFLYPTKFCFSVSFLCNL
jgi:ubiquinone/menaquinone biosynthesis C-methylase UbiE